MEIAFRTAKLEKLCNQFKAASRKWGKDNATKLQQQLQEISAAENLEQFCRLPAARCHKLEADRKGQWGCQLAHGMRLVFEPEGDPATFLEGGRLVPSKVTRIRIVEVKNYHG